MNIEELNQLYQEADGAAQELYAEQRSNLLLVSGQHYNKRGSKYWNRIREQENLSKEQKLRLTKNHVQKISKIYRNNLTSLSMGTSIEPKSESELSDVKSAQLYGSAWEDISYRHKFQKKLSEFIADFIDIGEMICVLKFDLNQGKFLGYEAETGEDGQPAVDEKGEPKGTPKFTGDHVFERVFGFNFLTDTSGISFETSRWVGVRKMVPVKDLKKTYAGDEEKLKLIEEGSDETFKIFDGQTGNYRDGKGMCMIREYYFRKCADYPNGYYFITTKAGILHEGEIPLGIFPVFYEGFDELQTSARAFSIIKQLRPYQAEVNRTASKIAEFQVTLGDDKLIMVGGGKMSAGGSAAGVKGISITGAAPTVIPGRTGEQYLPYMQSQIDEMYKAAAVQEDSEPAINGQLDAYAMLFRAVKDKKRFSMYAQKVERFIKELVEASLRFAKAYWSDDMIVPVIGRREAINIAEFRKSDDLCYQIKVVPSDEDVESKMGKQMVLNHALQFVGPNLDRSDIGMMMQSMPYGPEGVFDELTIDSENITNDMLALDRGEPVEVHPEDNHVYAIKKLTNRMKKADFRMLSPQVQQMYGQVRDQHRTLEAQNQQAAQQAASGYIPSGGYLVGCDFYIDVGGGKAPKRARVPYEALNWLVEKLEAQGSSQKAFQALDPASQADIGQKMGQSPQPNATQGSMTAGGPPPMAMAQ